ncbi:MFS transporter [Phycicoccus sp. MQZ13P-5]|uniref:MFS transporter n=1 Tax=Phycicoccus sonneratiae TaxID=2807628 RepID=A0ABS2CPC6_9MICO|nr:MFS transporter [Phycicoccus sonneraticus]
MPPTASPDREPSPQSAAPPPPGSAPGPGRSGRFSGSARAVGRGGAASARAVGRGGAASARAVGRGGRAAGRRFRRFAAADGAADTGLARLTELHAVNVAGDAAVTVSLAGTVFAMPTDEARGRVALFLLLTMAPFVLLAPLIGPLLDRFRHGRRWALGTTLATRGFLAWVLASAVVDDSPWLFPAALGCLVASRSYAVARAAAVPRLLPEGIGLVSANSRLNIAGIVGMVLGGGIAGAASRIGPDWSLRVAFVVFVAATVLAIRLPARVDSTAGEVDVDGTPAGEEPLDDPERGVRRMRALPVTVRYVLWLTTGARLLSGFLTLFLTFLMREHPLPGVSGPLVLGVVAGTAGVGNALGSLVGNRKQTPAPEAMATVIAGLALAAALVTALFYSLWALALLGLATGTFGQLAKLCLDALVQRDVADLVRARVFSWSETILQAFWVIGGTLGILVPLEPTLGFSVITGVVVVAVLVALHSRRTGRRRPPVAT